MSLFKAGYALAIAGLVVLAGSIVFSLSQLFWSTGSLSGQVVAAALCVGYTGLAIMLVAR